MGIAERIAKYAKLYSFGKSRAKKAQKQRPVLPLIDVDLNQFADEPTTLEFALTFFPEGATQRQKNVIQEMIGKKKIIFLNYVCITSARREPTNAAAALNLLRRIWREHSQTLSAELSLRWIVSTLQAFALTSDDNEERVIAFAGVTYGILIKIYETERLIQNRLPNEKYTSTIPQIKSTNEDGLGAFSVSHQDIARNLNADLFYLAADNDTVGEMLHILMERIAASNTVFSRLDEARQRLAPSFGGQSLFSFMLPPP